MANYCDNDFCIASSEKGIASVLRKMRGNLVATGWIEDSAGFECPSDIRELFKSVHDVVSRQPAYLHALSAEPISRGYSDTAMFLLREFENGVWHLYLSFGTAWGPSMEGVGEVLSDDSKYVFSHSWRVGDDGLAETYFAENGSTTYIDLDDEFYEYGDCVEAAAYSWIVKGEELPLNRRRFEKLARANNVKKLAEHLRERQITSFANGIDYTSLFRKGCYDTYELLLGVSTHRYVPHMLDRYLVPMCEQGRKSLLSVFVRRYGWTEKSLDLARKIVRESCANPEMLAFAERLLSEQEEKIEAERRTTEAKAERRTSEDYPLSAEAVKQYLSGDIVIYDSDGAARNIPDKCFMGNRSIKGAELFCRDIGKEAFADCARLEKVSMTSRDWSRICDRAFEGCEALSSFDQGKNRIWFFGTRVFNGCTSLVSLKLRLADATLKANAFGSAPHLESVSISGHGSIAKNAFKGCTGLKKVRIGKNIALKPGALSELPESVQVSAQGREATKRS